MIVVYVEKPNSWKAFRLVLCAAAVTCLTASLAMADDGQWISLFDGETAYGRRHPSQVDARIATYELAARMQMEASDALDLSHESQATLERYGVGQKPALQGIQYRNPGPDNYARRCIMARRLVERGVRYVQICLNSQIWDTHAYLEDGIRGACDRTDKPVAALLDDLKQRGLLDSTLVVWGGEFGRLPNGQMTEGNKREYRGEGPQFESVLPLAGRRRRQRGNRLRSHG